MTDDQKTPETDEPTPATETQGEQDVEGHKIPRPGGTQGGLTPEDEGVGPDGWRPAHQ
jgi:hypothetical protein